MKNITWDNIRKLVMDYDIGIEHNGKKYATIFGPNFRDVSHSTMDGDIFWSSVNEDLLSQINKEVFNNKGKIMKHREDEPIYILFIELKELNLKY